MDSPVRQVRAWFSRIVRAGTPQGKRGLYGPAEYYRSGQCRIWTLFEFYGVALIVSNRHPDMRRDDE